MSGLTFHHRIGRQRLLVEVDSRENALVLQPSLAVINRNRFLPLIERVLDEFDLPGRHVAITRLRVDLGTLPLAHFEEVAEQRLYHQLREALERALQGEESGEATAHRARSEEEARLELLEYYLLRGTLPVWAPT